MRGNGRRRRRGLIRALALGVALVHAAGCSSCVEDAKEEPPPAVPGPQLSPRPAKITDRRPHALPAFDDAGADASP
jgi:hypothetical protein